MQITFKRWMKPVVSTALVLTIALSGNLAFAAKPAQASTVEVNASSRADRIVSMGLRYLGAPYKFGAASGITSAFDCSSLMQYLYKKQGISLPRTSKAQSKVGSFVSRSNLKKGDLLFFSTPGSKGKVAHVGVYMGNGKFLHTYKKGIGVTTSKLSSSWWSSHYITARRVL
jgi:cell wall-associated NlpC family hydrolase